MFFSAWIESANMKPYFKYKARLMNANKTSNFKEAVDCIEKFIGENNIEVSDMCLVLHKIVKNI